MLINSKRKRNFSSGDKTASLIFNKKQRQYNFWYICPKKARYYNATDLAYDRTAAVVAKSDFEPHAQPYMMS